MDFVKAVRAVVYRLPSHKRYFCVYCKHHFSNFIPHKKGFAGSPALMRALDCVGSDLDNFECPWCGSTDRERHLLLYMKTIKLLPQLTNAKILHFAPEKRLENLITKKKPTLYIKCDLYPVRPDLYPVNIMEIPFKKKSFNLVIANHVLEHIENVTTAIDEILRVLKPRGFAILQTPYSNILKTTWSDSGIKTQNARKQAFGQEDHVRLFGKDIFKLFSERGLKNKVCHHNDILKHIDPVFYGVNSKEPFFLFQNTDDNL